MKKAFDHTRVSVKLRKSENYEVWHLYLEAYPVYEQGVKTPTRVREYINRSISTPLWDKNRKARTGVDGVVSYKPKRDVNGIIQCKSNVDQQTCIYADKIRDIRQREYDNAFLFTDAEAAQAEQNERSQCNFIEYFKQESNRRHKASADSTIVNWERAYGLLRIFIQGDTILFAQIDLSLMEEFKRFLLSAPQGGNKSGTISLNTASTYYSIFKAALKQAFIDGFLTIDLAAKSKGIRGQESRREYLTAEELNKLAVTPCDKPIMKRAALFSALTGLRHCDIQILKWGEIQQDGNEYKLNFTQQKTKGVEYMPISEQAYKLCGEPRGPEYLIFPDLPDPSWVSRPLKQWIRSAGITRNITFHCFRHTYATLQLAGGTDIYTVCKMLGHTNVKTTQVYAKVVDEKKNKATEAIHLNVDIDQIQN